MALPLYVVLPHHYATTLGLPLASVSTATTETNTGNNTGSVSVPVSDPALDLLANVVDNPDPVAVGDTMQYTYTVTNRGPSYAENVTLDATPPMPRCS